MLRISKLKRLSKRVNSVPEGVRVRMFGYGKIFWMESQKKAGFCKAEGALAWFTISLKFLMCS